MAADFQEKITKLNYLKKKGGRGTGCCCCCRHCSPTFVPIRPPLFMFACSRLPPPVPPPHSPTLIHPLPFARSCLPVLVRLLSFTFTCLPFLSCLPTLIRIRPFAFMFDYLHLCWPIHIRVCPFVFVRSHSPALVCDCSCTCCCCCPAATMCCWRSFVLRPCLLSACIHS